MSPQLCNRGRAPEVFLWLLHLSVPSYASRVRPRGSWITRVVLGFWASPPQAADWTYPAWVSEWPRRGLMGDPRGKGQLSASFRVYQRRHWVPIVSLQQAAKAFSFQQKIKDWRPPRPGRTAYDIKYLGRNTGLRLVCLRRKTARKDKTINFSGKQYKSSDSPDPWFGNNLFSYLCAMSYFSN